MTPGIYYALHYVNADKYYSLFNGYWTYGPLDNALLFRTEPEADSALQALRQEGKERLAANDHDRPTEMWWDTIGGCVVVRKVHVSIQRSDD